MLRIVTLAWIVTTATALAAAQPPAPVNPYKGMQQRADKFEFAAAPAVARQGDKWTVTFATSAACDATVAIVAPDGKVVRHLASGVLGKNAPYPFQQDTLSQRLEWDGKDDDGAAAPAGCKVKVSLGLDARFEQFDTWKLLAGIRPLAVDQAGQLYVVAQAGTPGAIHVFGKDGKYVRTLFPPSAQSVAEAKSASERFSLINWNRTTWGEWTPRRNRFGGGFEFDLTRLNNLFGNLACGLVAPDGKLYLLYSGKKGTLIGMDSRSGACPAESVISLGELVADGMAASPDGKWLYFAGKPPHPWEKHNPFSHAVTRTSLTTPAAPEVFLGEARTAGNDNAHFNGPGSIACDKDGNVYVGDRGNGRIQVFKPDGTYLATIAGFGGELVGVSQATGAVYVMGQKKDWTHDPIITKLSGLDKPAKVAEIEMRCGTNWRENSTSAVLANRADPPLIWFAGTSYRGKPVVAGIEDRGDKLVPTVEPLKANETPDAGGDVSRTGQTMQFNVDRRENKVCFGVIGPDGTRYVRAQFYAGGKAKGVPDNKMWVVRYDPKADEYLPFAHGDQSCVPDTLGTYRPWVHKGKPVIGVTMFYAKGAHLHQGSGLCVAPNGDLYVGATYSAETDAELAKAGLPRLQPKHLSAICAPALRVYAPDGTLRTPCALPGLAELEGLHVGRSGAVYVVQPFKPIGQTLPDGLAAGGSYDDSRWGTLIKFAGDLKTFPLGRIEGAWEGSPADATHACGGMKVKLHNALWSYGGVSPHSAKYSACTCLKATCDLDDYERSFVCAAQTCTINVIDSNGNVQARIGGYGNVDDLAAAKRLGLCLPRNVAVSDTTMWVIDIAHRAMIRAALVYRAEQTVSVP